MAEEIINYTVIDNADVNSSPYPYFAIDNIFNEDRHSSLLEDFPKINSGGSFPLSSLEIKGSIKELVKEIESDKFRNVFAKKFNVDLSNKPLIITTRGFSRSKDGKVHTDSKTKLITILIYFNDGWEFNTGKLRILNSDHLDNYASEFSSSIGQLIAFKVTDNCWHGYESFEGQRQSLQINYLVEEKYSSQHVYRHKISAFVKKLFK